MHQSLEILRNRNEGLRQILKDVLNVGCSSSGCHRRTTDDANIKGADS